MHPIHPDLAALLSEKDASLRTLFEELREFVFELYPEANELIYHTHAISIVFTPSLKMNDGYCHIPVYTKHLNLGFNRGTSLNDPHRKLEGTGKSIRHIPVRNRADFDNEAVRDLLDQAIQLSIDRMKPENLVEGQSVSKVKK